MQTRKNTRHQVVKDSARGTEAAHDHDAVQPLTRSASNLATRAANAVRSLIGDGRAMAVERIDATADRVGTAAREKPMRTLGIVAAAGLVVGLLLGRR